MHWEINNTYAMKSAHLWYESDDAAVTLPVSVRMLRYFIIYRDV